MIQQESVETNNKEVPLGYKKTKFGIFPSDWEVTGIKEIMERVRKPVEVKVDEQYKQIGIRSHGKGIFHKEAVSGKELGKKAVFWVVPDCFIVNIVFAWETAVAKTTENEIGYIASHRFPMYKPNENKLDLDFITYFFKSPRGKYLLNLASPGGAGRNKTLGQKEFGELKVVIPQSVKEQSKISRIISTWEKAIELKEKLIEQKKEQKKALMQKLLTGELRLPGFEGEWKEVRIKELGTLKGGSAFPEKYQNKVSGKYPFFKVSDMNNEENEKYMLKANNYISGEIRSEIKATIIPKNSIIFAKVGAALLLERKRILNFDSCIDNNMMALIVNENIDFNYVYYLLLNMKLSRFSNVGALPSLNSKDVYRLKCKLPVDYNEQKAIADLLALFDKQIELLQNDLLHTKKQTKGLMQLLLKGKVRVQV